MPAILIPASVAGVVTRAQALAGGLSPDRLRWLLRSGRWQRVYRGIYATHNGPLTPEQREIAALLYAGDGAVLSHYTAAARDGLAGFPTAAVHVTVPVVRRVREQPGIVVHRRFAHRLRRSPRPAAAAYPAPEVDRRHGDGCASAG
ncbi:MAG: type IV toxin-antitoxin system AbiEi family antitoxin domain-containing protein [Mycobacteriales bacterium]